MEVKCESWRTRHWVAPGPCGITVGVVSGEWSGTAEVDMILTASATFNRAWIDASLHFARPGCALTVLYGVQYLLRTS